MRKITSALVLSIIAVLIISGCAEVNQQDKSPVGKTAKTVPHEKKWGIYSLDLSSKNSELIYSSDERLSAKRC